jgi:hypothetical protein
MALRPLAVLLAFASLAGCTLIDLSQLGGGSGAGQTGGGSSAGNGPTGGGPDVGGGPEGASSGVSQGGGPNGGGPSVPSYDECVVSEGPAVYFQLNSSANVLEEPNLGTLEGTGSYTGSHMPFPGLVDNADEATLFTGKEGAGALRLLGAAGVLSGNDPFSLEAWVQMPSEITQKSLVNYEMDGNRLELRVTPSLGKAGSDSIELRFVAANLDERGVIEFLDLDNPDAQVLHIVAVYRQTLATKFQGDGSSDDMVLYINGQLASDETTGDPVPLPVFTASLGIGNGFDGLLDEVAVYPFELSAADVARHYAFGLDASLGCDGQ